MSIASHSSCEVTPQETKGGNQLVSPSSFRSPSPHLVRVSRSYLLPSSSTSSSSPRGYHRNLHRDAKVPFSGGQETPVDLAARSPIVIFRSGICRSLRSTKRRASRIKEQSVVSCAAGCLIYWEEQEAVCRRRGSEDRENIKIEYTQERNKIQYYRCTIATNRIHT